MPGGGHGAALKVRPEPDAYPSQGRNGAAKGRRPTVRLRHALPSKGTNITGRVPALAGQGLQDPQSDSDGPGAGPRVPTRTARVPGLGPRLGASLPRGRSPVPTARELGPQQSRRTRCRRRPTIRRDSGGRAAARRTEARSDCPYSAYTPAAKSAKADRDTAA